MKNKSILIASFALLIGFLISCNQVPKNAEQAVIGSYSDTWKFQGGEGQTGSWETLGFDDSSWKDVTTQQFLRAQDAAPENGFGWYRKKVQLSDSLKSAIKEVGAAVLHLGRLGGCEEIYINGKLISKTGEFPPNYVRGTAGDINCVITEDQLNDTGDNLIAVKFYGAGNMGGFRAGSKTSISSATTNDKLALNVTVADLDYIFMSPNPISITVNLENKNNWNADGILVVKLTTDDYQSIKADSVSVQMDRNGNFSKSFEFSNPDPGFYRYTVQFKRNAKVALEKKFNVGFEPEKINSPIDAKPDFKAFWDNSLKELAKVAPKYKLIPQPELSKQDYDVYIVEMQSFGNETVKGYYAKPKREGKFPVIVEYVGYGSRSQLPNQKWDGFAYFVQSTRGQALNRTPESDAIYSHSPSRKDLTQWITYRLDNKDAYYYRGAFLDVVRAIDFVCSRPEIDSEKIAVRGGSQGGAFSFVAAALDKRVKAAAPGIPFLSDYRDYFKIAPWPKSDFDIYVNDHPEAKWDDIYDLLTYFDVKNLTQWIECPVIMGIGVQDDVCPPHTNFAAYNQVKSEKRWIAAPEEAHNVSRDIHEASTAFIKEKLNVK